MKNRLAVVALLLAPAPLLAQPFGRSGSEFRVNTYTPGVQVFPSAAYDASGTLLIVWEGVGPGDISNKSISGQRYTATGAPIGGQFRLNTFTTGVQLEARASGGPTGQFVVVWRGSGYAGSSEDGDSYGVFGQRVGAAGPVGPEFRVNTYTTGSEGYPDVAMDATGGFVVVWAQPDGASDGVFGRRYASDGSPLAAPFRVNAYTTGQQRFPSVASLSSGEFVVAWQSHGQFGANDFMVGRRYSSAGAALTSDFQINTVDQFNTAPRVAPVGTGFVVAWEATSDGDVLARRYSSTGAPLVSPFRVNTYTSNVQANIAVAGDSTGRFTISWRTSLGEDGDLEGIFAQRFASSGAPAGAEFRVNTYTTSHQDAPGIAMSPNGSFVIAWHGWDQDGSTYGAFAQRFCSQLAGDANGDNTITVSDVFWLINNLYAGGPLPIHDSDANGDGATDVLDVFYLINMLFAGGGGPVCV